MDLIRFENVGISYAERKILSGFDLSVKAGEKLLITGRSGTGKSTLMKMLLGFVKPMEGLIYFKDKKLDGKEVWEIRKLVAHVSQNTDVGEGKVLEVIREIFLFGHNRGKLWEEELMPLLEYFELDKDTLAKKFESLSGGEKQRICIIIALLLGKEIFLLDEITSELDAQMKSKVAEYFLGKREWTVIAVSHDNTWVKDGVRVVDIASYAGGMNGRSL